MQSRVTKSFGQFLHHAGRRTVLKRPGLLYMSAKSSISRLAAGKAINGDLVDRADQVRQILLTKMSLGFSSVRKCHCWFLAQSYKGSDIARFLLPLLDRGGVRHN